MSKINKYDVIYYYDKYENRFVVTHYGALEQFDIMDEDVQYFVSERSAIVECKRISEKFGVKFIGRLYELED